MKLIASPETALRLASGRLPSAPALPPGGPGQARVEVAVCYDGNWFQNVARYVVATRGAQLLVEGFHDAIRWHAAGVFGCPVRQVAISHAHYVAGRDPDAPTGGWDQVLSDHGITRHDVPVTAAKGEVGADVEFALTAYQLAIEARPDMIALVAGDGDFAPLAIRLAARGLRVLVPVANVTYRAGQRTISITSSTILTRRATDAPALTALIDVADDPGYPPWLHRPLAARTAPAAAAPAGAEFAEMEPAGDEQFTGTITRWNPGSPNGLITSDGRTWYASMWETPGRQPLPTGTRVTFTGDPTAPVGKSYPRARVITPDPPGGQPHL